MYLILGACIFKKWTMCVIYNISEDLFCKEADGYSKTWTPSSTTISGEENNHRLLHLKKK